MKKQITPLFVAILFLGIISGCNTKTDTATIPLNNNTDSVSYIIGADYANLLLSNEFEINPEAFYKGFDMAIKGTDNFPDSIKASMIEQINLQNQMIQQEKMIAMVQQNKEIGAEFLAQNKTIDGIQQLPDGLQFRVLKRGSGPSPLPSDSVLIHYRAMFIDGTTFDESYQRGPQVARLNGVVPGLSKGLQLMNAGSIYEFFLPPELAYGDQGIENVIPGGVTIVYSVELIEIY